MGTEVHVRNLIRFETADDGSFVRIFVEDAAGRSMSIALPINCLSSLIMTLPEMMEAAVQNRARDPSLRVVFTLGRFAVELSPGGGTRIVTLQTPDGFAVSFGLSEGQCQEMGQACLGGGMTAARIGRVVLN